MAETTTTNLANILITTYDRSSYFEPFEQNATPFLSEVESLEGEAPYGSSLKFDIWLADAHAGGAVAESGSFATAGQPSIVQGSVNAIQYHYVMALSELMLEAGRRDGTFRKDVLNEHVMMTTRNLLFGLNTALVAGHGTGRLGVVEATTTSATTFVLRNPEHVVQVRPNFAIDFYNTDTGGTKQGATETISDINFETRTITIGNARSLTAGWGIYKAISSSVSSYGIAVNGMRGIADNGVLNASLFGLTRSTNPGINATVLSANGGTQSWSEALFRKALHRSFYVAGCEPDEIWMNKGIVSEHLNVGIQDRIFSVPAGGTQDVPGYAMGYKKLPGMQYDGTWVPYRVDGTLPAREAIFIKKSFFRKHILRPTSWLGDGTGVGGSSSPVLMQAIAAAGGNYALAKVAAQIWMGNMTHKRPRSLIRVTEIADAELAGDS